MRGAAPDLDPIQTKSVPLKAGSFAGTECREADASVPVPMYVTLILQTCEQQPISLRFCEDPPPWEACLINQRFLKSYFGNFRFYYSDA